MTVLAAPSTPDAISRVLRSMLTEHPLRPSDLVRLTSALADRLDLWGGLVRHDAEERWYTPLARAGQVEVWLLGWTQGQATTLHDHGGSIGAFTVCTGRLTETTAAGTTLVNRTLLAGTGRSFDAEHVHDVTCPDTVATSLHAYSPPLSSMRYFDVGPHGLRHVDTLALDDSAALIAADHTVAA